MVHTRIALMDDPQRQIALVLSSVQCSPLVTPRKPLTKTTLTLTHWLTRNLPASQGGRGLARTLARVPLDLCPTLIRHTTITIISLSSMKCTVSQSPPSLPPEFPQGNTRSDRSRRNTPVLLPALILSLPRRHTKPPSLPSPNTTACLRPRRSSSLVLHVQRQRPVSLVSALAEAGSVGKIVKLVYSWPPVETDILFTLFTLTLDIPICLLLYFPIVEVLDTPTFYCCIASPA